MINTSLKLKTYLWFNLDLRVGQVRVIFSLPEKVLQALFPLPGVRARVPRHLVYVEWFSSFAAGPDERYQMYKVKKLTGAAKIASVVPLTLVKRSVHLFPKWGGPAPRHWASETILDECTTYFLNPYKDPHSFYNLY